jgi:hypothetical protein
MLSKNNSVRFDCGAKPSCATSSSDKMKKLLPSILGGVGGAIVLSGIFLMWRRVRAAAVDKRKYNDGLAEWQQHQKRNPNQAKEPLLDSAR